jgi:hypothetical protein
VHSLPSRLRIHRAYVRAIACALGFAPFQGSEPTAVVIEYRGPSNEFLAPILLASPGMTCADVRRVMAAMKVTIAPSQCPVEMASSELAAMTRSLKTFHPDSDGSLSLEPGLLRVTILERDSVFGVLAIPRHYAGRALDVFEQQIPLSRYPALSRQLTEWRQRLSASGLVPLPRLNCGIRADSIDDTVQSRIIQDLTRLPPTWSVRTRGSRASRSVVRPFTRLGEGDCDSTHHLDSERSVEVPSD